MATNPAAARGPLTQEHVWLIRSAGLASVAVALVLVTLKLFAWFATGSVAMLGSLTDSLFDLLASSMTFFAVRFAFEPADREQDHFRAEHVGGLRLDVAVEHAGDQVGVHLDAGIGGTDRRRPQVEEPRRGGADERDLALEALDRNLVVVHVGERDVPEAPFAAAVRYERAGVLVDRDACDGGDGDGTTDDGNNAGDDDASTPQPTRACGIGTIVAMPLIAMSMVWLRPQRTCRRSVSSPGGRS